MLCNFLNQTYLDSALSTTAVISKNDSLEPEDSVTVPLDLPTADTVNADKCPITETLDSSPSEMPSQAPNVESAGTQSFTVKIWQNQLAGWAVFKVKATTEFDISISGTIYYGIVTVTLNNQEVASDGCVQEEDAIKSAYRKLAYQFGLTSLEGGCIWLCDCNSCTDLTRGLIRSIASALCNR